MASPREQATITVHRVGAEQLPVIVIDSALQQAKMLVELAAAGDWSVTSPFYPGIRATAPQDYASALARVLTPIIQRAFAWPNAEVSPDESTFSLVTTREADLVPFQRVPHFDGTDPYTLAALHFLCETPDTGTAFYRHNETGYESVVPERLETYQKSTDAEHRLGKTPQSGFIRGSGALFTQTALIEGRFNRLLVYQGHTLHCGYIPPDFSYSDDPRKGRLTANTFLRVTPR